MPEAKRHMQVEIHNNSRALCNVSWRYSIRIQYNPYTVTCERCLSIMRSAERKSLEV